MSELCQRCDGDVRVARERKGVEGEKDTEPGFHGCEGGPEAFKAQELGGGVGVRRWWRGGETVGVYCEVGGVDVELKNY